MSEPNDWSTKELFEMADTKVEQEIDQLMFQRRMLIERHKQELDPIERKLTQLKKRKTAIMDHMVN